MAPGVFPYSDRPSAQPTVRQLPASRARVGETRRVSTAKANAFALSPCPRHDVDIEEDIVFDNASPAMARANNEKSFLPRLPACVSLPPTPKPRRGERKPPKSSNVTRLADGPNGWPIVLDYDAQELKKWFFFCFGRSFPATEFPRSEWHLNPHLLRWIHEKGSSDVERIVRYSCESWLEIQHGFDGLCEVEYPTLAVIYGYREGIERQMLRSFANATQNWKYTAPVYEGVSNARQGPPRSTALTTGF